MNWKTIVAALSIVVVAGTLSQVLAGGFGLGTSGKKTFTINNKVGENEVKFISTAPMEDINGTAKGISGSVVLDPENLEATTAKLVIAVKSMKTGIKKRDKHLYSNEWLDAEQYPEIRFSMKKLSEVQSVSSDAKTGRAVAKAKAVGDFFLHGVSLEMTIPVTITYIRESEKTRERAPGDFLLVQTEFSVPLGKFNVTGKKGIIGSKVGEEISVKATLFAAS